MKDLEFLNKHDYDKEEAIKYADWNGKTFSVNIFKWILKSNGKQLKRSNGFVRVVGKPSDRDKVFDFCDLVVSQLNEGEWDGRKTVVVNWQ